MLLEHLLFWYVVVLLAALGGVALLDEHRRRGFEPDAKKDNIFRCGGCGSVYTDDPDVDRSQCPQCGQSNEAVEF